MVFTEDAVIANSLMRQALIVTEGIIGERELTTTLRTSGLERYIENLPPNDRKPAVRTSEYARFFEAIELLYGRGARTILRRIGKAQYQYSLQENATLSRLIQIALKFLPEKIRIQAVLNRIIGAHRKGNPQLEAWVETLPNGKIAFVERTCANCYGRISANPVCHMYIGVISEAVQWATGKDYDIRETHCVARGDEFCRYEVSILQRKTG